MRFDPYKILGLKPGATAAEIRTAHRKAVRKHHPDRGGDPEKMKEAQKAYEILNDPARLALWTETGQSETSPAGDMTEILEMIGDAMIAAVAVTCEAGMNVESVDFIRAIECEISGMRDVLRKEIREGETMVKALTAIQPRFRQKHGGDNLMGEIAAERLSLLQSQIRGAETEMNLLSKALTYVKECEYSWPTSLGDSMEPDTAPASDTPAAGKAYWRVGYDREPIRCEYVAHRGIGKDMQVCVLEGPDLKVFQATNLYPTKRDALIKVVADLTEEIQDKVARMARANKDLSSTELPF